MKTFKQHLLSQCFSLPKHIIHILLKAAAGVRRAGGGRGPESLEDTKGVPKDQGMGVVSDNCSARVLLPILHMFKPSC